GFAASPKACTGKMATRTEPRPSEIVVHDLSDSNCVFVTKLSCATRRNGLPKEGAQSMKTAHFIFATVLAMGAALSASGSVLAADQPHNIVLFAADGSAARIVNNQTAPVMASVRDKGVRFANSHSIFPTFTTANASSMATGHFLGDTGDFSNTIYTGFPVPGAGNSLTPFLESDPVLGDVDEHFSGDYLDEITILRAAREAGL